MVFCVVQILLLIFCLVLSIMDSVVLKSSTIIIGLFLSSFPSVFASYTLEVCYYVCKYLCYLLAVLNLLCKYNFYRKEVKKWKHWSNLLQKPNKEVDKNLCNRKKSFLYVDVSSCAKLKLISQPSWTMEAADVLK